MSRYLLLLFLSVFSLAQSKAQSDTVKAFINYTLNYTMPQMNTFEISYSTLELGFEKPLKGKENQPNSSIEELKNSLQDSIEDAIIYTALGSAFDSHYQIDSARVYHAKAVVRANQLLLKYPDSISCLNFMVASGLYLNELEAVDNWLMRFKPDSTNQGDYLLLRYLVCNYTGCALELRDEIRMKYKNDSSNLYYIYLLTVIDFQTEGMLSFFDESKKIQKLEEVLPMPQLKYLPNQEEAKFDYDLFRLGYYSIYHLTHYLNQDLDSLSRSPFLNETENARERVEKIMRSKSFNNEVTANFHLGTSYLSEHEYKKAIKYLKRSIKETPDNIGNGMTYNNEKAYNNLFATYLMMGDTSEAIELLKQKLEDKPAGLLEVDDYLDLATLYYDLGQNDKAREYLKLSFDLTENKPEAWLLKAVLDRREFGVSEGMKALEKAYELNKEKAEVYLLYALFYAELGDRKTAKSFADLVYKVRPDNSLAANLISVLYLW